MKIYKKFNDFLNESLNIQEEDIIKSAINEAIDPKLKKTWNKRTQRWINFRTN